MRKFIIAVFVLSIMFTGATAYAVDCTKDTPIDQVGDWLATLGKKDLEKDRILAQRKADRVATCTKKEAQKAASNVKKSLGF